MAALSAWGSRARTTATRAIGHLADWATHVGALALPQRCPSCGAVAAAERFLCEPCRAAIPKVAMPVCAHCLTRGREPVGCHRHPKFSVWPAWVYEERAACLVQALKYEQRLGLAPGLGGELARALPRALDPDLILAVPLHGARQRERGYNQAALLAEALAAELAVPCLAGALTRIRATRPQARLTGSARRDNVWGAFRVEAPERMKGRRVLIVDDVITTGATFEACLAVLAAAGAEAGGVALAWAQ